MITVLWMYVEFIFYRSREIWDVSRLRVWWRSSLLRRLFPFFMIQDVSLDMPGDRRREEEKKNQ